MRLGGHLGATASALVDGQLGPVEEERAWVHVHRCAPCRRLVEHEGWTKRQLSSVAGGEPSARLLGSLYGLDARREETADAAEVQASWAAVHRLEEHARGRRRVGIAAVGVGSVSAAVLGMATLSGAPLGIGNAPSAPPATSLTRPSTPSSSPAGSATSRPTGSPLPGPVLHRDPVPPWAMPRSAGDRAVPVLAPR
ncbi:hypothetical protein [Nocardioides mesophilus]|uniref:Zf-HC2 domain-containing protein n=1 Tax=Nocardioides mesophilus TaxID=433659 RepID=A0A7G9R807_9ACTN|nr:hypothetical protein [Nocardioides mesophilus]QNN51732.1 hypothetical protein H9L09_14350 [Nocardioides mesophilus]